MFVAFYRKYSMYVECSLEGVMSMMYVGLFWPIQKSEKHWKLEVCHLYLMKVLPSLKRMLRLHCQQSEQDIIMIVCTILSYKDMRLNLCKV